MAGMKGRSGGQNRRPLQDHIERGTYRQDRHGARPATTGHLTVMPPLDRGWQPAPAELRMLSKAGRAFLDPLLAEFEFTRLEGTLALEAAHAVDRLHGIRSLDRDGASLRELAAVERLDQAWSKILSGLVLQLKVTR